MKAIVKYAEKPGTLALRDMPKPEPGHGEVVVQLKTTGICYTDISILENKYKGRKPVPIPVILGHEGAGIVAEAKWEKVLKMSPWETGLVWKRYSVAGVVMTA
jgi:D-arabinose 1-dehydrogenase-like Zn-dependent alcohol dehydrogenase